MHIAAMYGHTHLITTLASLGADISAEDEHLTAPVHYAAACNQPATIETLERLGANLNVRDVNGRTSVHHAAMCSHSEAIEILARLGADMEVKDCFQRPPLDFCPTAKVTEVLWNAIDRQRLTATAGTNTGADPCP